MLIVCRIFLIALCCWMSSSAQLRAQDAKPPFDGKTFAGWTMQDGRPVDGGWEIKDGVIHLRKEKTRTGHIVTATEYGDFTLEFDWKIAQGGNSGIKYRVRSYGTRVLGCEYQVYDDEGAKKEAPKRTSASLYDVYEPNDRKKLKPAGEWNHAKIVVAGNSIEHWLNGELVVSATVGSDEWKKRVADSKFNDARKFGENPKGKLMLTDHGSEVWYRNFVFQPKE